MCVVHVKRIKSYICPVYVLKYHVYTMYVGTCTLCNNITSYTYLTTYYYYNVTLCFCVQHYSRVLVLIEIGQFYMCATCKRKNNNKKTEKKIKAYNNKRIKDEDTEF